MVSTVLLVVMNLILGVIAFLITQVFAILTLFLLIRNVPSIEGYDMYQIGNVILSNKYKIKLLEI